MKVKLLPSQYHPGADEPVDLVEFVKDQVSGDDQDRGELESMRASVGNLTVLFANLLEELLHVDFHGRPRDVFLSKVLDPNCFAGMHSKQTIGDDGEPLLKVAPEEGD